MTAAPLRIIQISDTHIFAKKDQILVGVPTYQSLAAVIELIKQKAGEFDLFIHTGDLTQDYTPESYLLLAEMLSTFKLPIYCIPGNHDDPAVMARVYPYQQMKTDRRIMTETWQIILLSTNKKNAVEGYLSKEELDFLENSLKEYPKLHAMVMFHHQPMPVGSAWLDKLGLSNAEDFWKVISRFKNVKNIIFGHVHQEFEKLVNNIQCYSAPSTCIQFKRKSAEFAIERLTPGIRSIHLFDDGHIETKVLRTDKYIGEFDDKTRGY